MKSYLWFLLLGMALPNSLWADTTTLPVEPFQASIMAFGVPETQALKAAERAVADIKQQQTQLATPETTTTVSPNLTASWLIDPYHID